MNRLWVRLSVAFSIIIIASVVAILLTTFSLRGRNAIHNIVTDNATAPGGLVDSLAEYYVTNQSLEGAEAIVLPRIYMYTPGRKSPITLTLTNENGDILFTAVDDFADAPPYNYATSQPLPFDEPLPIITEGRTRGIFWFGLPPGQPPIVDAHLRPPNISEETLPIVVDGQSRGTLRVGIIDEELDSTLDMLFNQRLVRSIIYVAIGGSIIGILFGVFISRTMTAPLNHLAGGAHAIRDRHFDERVAVKGSAEIVAVATAFNEMAHVLEESEQMRRNLVADVAHELRTPLSVLQGNLYAILDDVRPFDKEQASRLYDQTRILSRLVDDLHELSQAEARQLHLDVKPVDVAQLVHETVETFRPVAEDRGVQLNTHIPMHLPQISVDPQRILQVLHNLLNNALLHTPPEGIVTVTVAEDTNTVYLRVADTGQGIEAEHIPHVFERFYRTDPNRSRATGGTGLGLAIVRALVEAQGGTVAVVSDGVPGKGATFTVRLPAQA